jgi:hypothetical protein
MKLSAHAHPLLQGPVGTTRDPVHRGQAACREASSGQGRLQARRTPMAHPSETTASHSKLETYSSLLTVFCSSLVRDILPSLLSPGQTLFHPYMADSKPTVGKERHSLF